MLVRKACGTLHAGNRIRGAAQVDTCVSGSEIVRPPDGVDMMLLVLAQSVI
jgi:hypothetical protein